MNNTAIIETVLLQYSTSSQLYTYSRFFLEMSNTNNIVATYEIKTGKILLINSFGDTFIKYIEVPFIVLLLFVMITREV